MSHFCHFANSSVTHRDRIPPVHLISALFCAQISSKNKRGQRVFSLKESHMGNFRVTLQLQLQVKLCFCCGEIPEAPGRWSRSETPKSPALHKCHCLPLPHAPTILPWLAHVVHYTQAVWLLLPDPWRNVVGYQTEGCLQCSRWTCFRIYQVIPKKKQEEKKLLFLFFSSVLCSELSCIYSHSNNHLPAMVSPIGEVLCVYLRYPFLPCPTVRSHK